MMIAWCNSCHCLECFTISTLSLMLIDMKRNLKNLTLLNVSNSENYFLGYFLFYWIPIKWRIYLVAWFCWNSFFLLQHHTFEMADDMSLLDALMIFVDYNIKESMIFVCLCYSWMNMKTELAKANNSCWVFQEQQ